ncbi:hypothetical protein FNW02_34535 [Komarekiella sp. 'clone 1']|uniref:Uncharacterized protein n=1 Tax=Komarekiella delphini-convector SJRDD-AB1 TaxID=2593771 RepID=A0AA40VUZ9_9NOST|nr:hypothetical protein [Komarekiella delphini-convector]MBD6620742.1 hypothetical protein [Komarekiella delphini-convector SJRDD-AB1]
MNISSSMAMAIAQHWQRQLMFSKEVYFYLDLAQDFGFLHTWKRQNEQLVLTFYEGTQKSLDCRSTESLSYLKEQVEFFAEVTTKL